MALKITVHPIIDGTKVVWTADSTGTPPTKTIDTTKLEITSVPLTFTIPYEARKIVNGDSRGITVDEFRKNIANANIASALIASKIVDNSEALPKILYVSDTKDDLETAINL